MVGLRKNFPSAVEGIHKRRVPYLMDAKLFNGIRDLAAKKECSISQMLDQIIRRGLKRTVE